MKKRSYLLLLIIACCFFVADADAQKTKKDIDGDGVPNKLDHCPNIPGLNTEAMKGCPDSDGDGITDEDDRCPLDKGPDSGSYPGCPGTEAAVNTTGQPTAAKAPATTPLKPLKGDRDGDGVADKDDRCPDTPGANNPGVLGCPDRDNDWVGDAYDLCPDEQGNTLYKGCPNDPDPALKITREQRAIRDSISIDSLRELFYPAFDKAYTYAERVAALQEFKDNIIKVTDGTGYINMWIAIKPVMQTRTLGKPELGDQIATIWENGQLYKTSIISMMNKKDQEYLEQLRKDRYEAWIKSEAERVLAANTPPPAQPRTKEQECQQKLYDAQQGRGHTYFYQNDMVIMESYDCATDLYTVWRPRQGNDGNMEPKGKRMQVRPEWGRWTPAVLKKYHRCGECEGDGDVLLVTYDTKTKDLPQGYFSGIQTTKTTTTKKTTTQSCQKCSGLGWLLY